MSTYKSALLLSLTLFATTTVAAAPPSLRVQQTQRALDSLVVASDSKAHWDAISTFPFDTNARTRTDAPYIPFKTNNSELYRQYTLIPSALRVLAARQEICEDNIRRQEDAQDIALTTSILATIGGRQTIDVALPALLKTLASRRDDNGLILTVMSGIVTLCNPHSAVSEINSVMKSNQDPLARAAAALTIGLRNRLMGDIIVNKMPDGSYQLLPEQATFQNAFVNSIPALAQTAAQDKDSSVRLAALEGLHEGIYGTRSASWSKALPYLRIALQDTENDTKTRRMGLRVLAEMPYSSPEVLPVLRTALVDSDDLTRGYAFIALDHLMINNSDSVTKTLCSDLAKPTRCKSTIHQLASAIPVVWKYGNWYSLLPNEINPNDNLLITAELDLRRKNKSEGQQNAQRYLNEQSFRELQRHTLLLNALRNYGLKSEDPEISLDAARSLEKIGTDIDNILGHGGKFGLATPDIIPVRNALLEASDVIRLSDPSLSSRLTLLSKRICEPHICR